MTDDMQKQRYERVLELASRAFAEIPSDSLVTRSQRDGWKVHPAVGAWLRAERAAIEFGKAVGAEEDHSKRPMGRPTGAASAPDRRTPPRITRIK
jgi:hypothetical protein